MSDYLQEKIGDAFHEAKGITFPHASGLESFARGVEEGLFKAFRIAKEEPRTHCAGCGEYKLTPLRRDEFGGYICLTCVDKQLNIYLVEKLKNASHQ